MMLNYERIILIFQMLSLTLADLSIVTLIYIYIYIYIVNMFRMNHIENFCLIKIITKFKFNNMITAYRYISNLKILYAI